MEDQQQMVRISVTLEPIDVQTLQEIEADLRLGNRGISAAVRIALKFWREHKDKEQ